MKATRTLILTAMLFAVATASAGTMHPGLEARLSALGGDEPVSVLVHLTEQAPVASLSASLHDQRATRLERHRQIVTALREAAASQTALKAHLDQRRLAGGVLGYTPHWITNLIVVQATKDEILQLLARPDVAFIESNFSVELIEPVSRGGSRHGGRQIGVTPGLRAINADRVWYELGYTGAGRLVGSLDTGVDGTHPALADRYRGNHAPAGECWLDVINEDTDFPIDFNDHGTHTTGTMAGVAEDDTIGVAWRAEWIACNAIDQVVNPGFDNDILNAIEWFTDPDGDPTTVDDVPDVVQNSWGISENFGGDYVDCDSRWWVVIDNCEAAGVFLCWSAGNDGPNPRTVRSPADRATTLYNAFSVGAVDATNHEWPYPIANFSSRGPTGCAVAAPNRIKPEVVAPGVAVYSSVPGGDYLNFDGTSMAGPHVAGIVALMREADQNLDVDTIKQIIMDHTVDEGIAGEDNTFGWGFVDAYAAVLAVTDDLGRLEGHVYNASYGNLPIFDAAVTLAGTNYRYPTDAGGAYGGGAVADTYTAEANRAGFAAEQVVVSVVAATTTTQDFYLTDNAGPEITVTDYPAYTADTAGPYLVFASVHDFSSVSGVALLHRVDEGAWQEVPMHRGRDFFMGEIPGAEASSRIDFYLTAEDGLGFASAAPNDAPASYFTFFVTQVVYSYDAEDPADPDWTLGVPEDTATGGVWIRDDPIGTDYFGAPLQPEDDVTPDPGVKCFVTANGTVGGDAYEADVDDGCTTLVSPTFDLSQAQLAYVHYWRWYAEYGISVADNFDVDVSNDGGETWIPFDRVYSNKPYWEETSVLLTDVIELSGQIVFRFVACDFNQNTALEAAIDDFAIETVGDPVVAVPGDDFVPASTQVAYLLPGQPNPFRPASGVTTMALRLRETADAQLCVYDLAGRLVRTLHSGELAAGRHQIAWNGTDNRGRTVGSGVYFCRLRVGEFEACQRMTVLR